MFVVCLVCYVVIFYFVILLNFWCWLNMFNNLNSYIVGIWGLDRVLKFWVYLVDLLSWCNVLIVFLVVIKVEIDGFWGNDVGFDWFWGGKIVIVDDIVKDEFCFEVFDWGGGGDYNIGIL